MTPLKTCTKCREEKPGTPEFFVRASPGAKSRSGVTSPCRECHKKRMKIYNPRNYAANRGRGLLNGYRQADQKAGRPTLITAEQVDAVISEPCHYCGTADVLRGLDRIDNAIGHSLGNVVSCCHTCNMVRNDLFSVEEMKLLGAVIAQIREARL